MKKNYVKPELFYESFVLSQHIAGCNLTINAASVLVCSASGTVDTGYGILQSEAWFTATPTCTSIQQDYCYTNGSITAANINS